MKTSSLLFASLSLVVACGGGGSSKNPPLIDAPQSVDAPPPQSDCTAPAAITAVTNPFFAYGADTDPDTTGNQEAWFAGFDLNSDALVDWINIELYEGPPPGYTTANFPSTPFTIQLAAGELDYGTCSTCLSLQTDVDLENSTQDQLVYQDDYFATGGSITITTLTSTKIAGTLNNVTFTHTDFSQSGQTPNPSGCTSTAANVPFEAEKAAAANARGNGVRFSARTRLPRSK